MPPPITIIGAGLAGALLATLLARRGLNVAVIERRADPRRVGYQGGRSINLALAERGLHGLRLAGLEANVMAQAVMMRGRMIHELGADPYLQRYGRDDSEVIWSVGRGQLNLSLIEAAEAAGAQITFDAALVAVDWRQQRYRCQGSDGVIREQEFHTLIGADGAGSALRAAMQSERPNPEHFEPLGHGYKELAIPATAAGGFQIDGNALHIWPRGGYMLIALPNVDGSFTVTLFLPNSGAVSFEQLWHPMAVQAFFAQQFPDALPSLANLVADFTGHPVGMLGTLRLQNWHLDGRALLLGDAAHALVPFHGQGMNCAFEDCVALDALFSESTDLPAVYAEFQARRQPNAEAIADMALENYVEMRDAVADAHFHFIKQLERQLAERHPGRFVPRYSMISFRRVPYAEAQARGAIQANLMEQLGAGKQRLDQIDMTLADRLIEDRLAPL